MGRNLYDPAVMVEHGFSYYSVGRPAALTEEADGGGATEEKGARLSRLLTYSWRSPPGHPLRPSLKTVIDAVESVRENFSRPSGTGSVCPLFPALKRRAIFERPSGAGLCGPGAGLCRPMNWRQPSNQQCDL
jgi:hypothetical protein